MSLKISKGDEVAGVELLPQPGDVFMAATDGSAKRVPVAQFPKQGRYGQGVLAWKLPGKGRVVGVAVGKGTARVTLHLSKLAPKMVRLDEAPLQTRAARGKTIQELKTGEQVLRLTVPWDLERPLQDGEPRKSREGKPQAREESGTSEPLVKPAVITSRTRRPKTGDPAQADGATRRSRTADKPSPARKPAQKSPPEKPSSTKRPSKVIKKTPTKPGGGKTTSKIAPSGK